MQGMSDIVRCSRLFLQLYCTTKVSCIFKPYTYARNELEFEIQGLSFSSRVGLCDDQAFFLFFYSSLRYIGIH